MGASLKERLFFFCFLVKFYLKHDIGTLSLRIIPLSTSAHYSLPPTQPITANTANIKCSPTAECIKYLLDADLAGLSAPRVLAPVVTLAMLAPIVMLAMLAPVVMLAMLAPVVVLAMLAPVVVLAMLAPVVVLAMLAPVVVLAMLAPVLVLAMGLGLGLGELNLILLAVLLFLLVLTPVVTLAMLAPIVMLAVLAPVVMLAVVDALVKVGIGDGLGLGHGGGGGSGEGRDGGEDGEPDELHDCGSFGCGMKRDGRIVCRFGLLVSFV